MADVEGTAQGTAKGTVESTGFLAKVIGPKKRWKAYKVRAKELPEPYRAAVGAIERHLMHFVPTDGENNAAMFEDLADLFEGAATNGTPISEIVGDDPAGFVEDFSRNYTDGGYVPARARTQLAEALAEAAGGAAGK
ncbi:DUF1048 domain-containing protein [Streptomyces sp. NBC_00237]|uniref:DUF1048 domain-containing protein n=1 Tax=Streptomyces sp. NBC_00237 TaxID=2975687 RepID=UPI00225403E5|nr:DUF1048 domain-containing protein [Streptomyces sp. NBC_00237]MCX5205126.1 DUF1048 domain-containing protein [Streptomyces sp. NBC_00237]